MDIVDFWKQLVEKFNTDNKCDFCWSFGAPLQESAVNKQQVDPGCCVNLFVSDVTKNTIRGYSNATGLLNSKIEDYGFVLYVVKKDDIGTNNYNEILGHPIDESKWETILRPLQECLSEDNVLAFCEILGEVLRVTQWRMETKINYLDNNYTGWMIRGTFRKQII